MLKIFSLKVYFLVYSRYTKPKFLILVTLYATYDSIFVRSKDFLYKIGCLKTTKNYLQVPSIQIGLLDVVHYLMSNFVLFVFLCILSVCSFFVLL